MIVCPVCEHQQVSGDECDQCGKRLSSAAVNAPAVARMQELEPTALVRPGIQVSNEPMSELEVTRLSKGIDLPDVRVPDLEPTRAVTVGEVAVQAVPELDLGRIEDDGARTALPTGKITCRYCGSTQADGTLCERCGMKLPRTQAAATEPARSSSQDGDSIRCPKCAMPARVGKRCINCGAEVEAGAP